MAVRPRMLRIVATTTILSVLTLHSPAFAQVGTREAQIVVDAETNEVLYENNAQEPRRPASITKVMTLYLLFDALQKGSVTWDDRIVFSRNAASQPPTKLFVAAGNSIPVQTAVEALVLRSANDVATAVAEHLGGTETNFAQMMTSKARELGMSSTTFRNASGLPNATQRTTAEDLARLAIAIQRDFPQQYHWFSLQQMSWNGQTITGHNHLMSRMAGMDGLKTGYTNASGFNLAATTQRDGRRIVTVVLGGANRFLRDDLVEALTESAFRELGVGAIQYANNITAYQISFRDDRDAADAAALIMDMPPQRITPTNTTSIAMSRSGRRLGFEQGAPTFQVADMSQSAPAISSGMARGTQLAQREENDSDATDEGESDVVRPSVNKGPLRTQATPTRVPVIFPPKLQVTQSATVDTPSRQMAQAQITSSASAFGATLPPYLRGTIIARAAIVQDASRQTEEAASPQAPSLDTLMPTQLAELAQQDAASLASTQVPQPAEADINTALNGVDASTTLSPTQSPESSIEAAPTKQSSEAQPIQMAALSSDAAAQAQIRQSEANSREQARLAEAQAMEATRREAVRVQAAAAARVNAERRATQRLAERQLADARAKTLKEKEARDLALADRQATQERAVAARDEERRQADGTRERNARGTSIVQVGAFKDKDDANAAIAQFARFFPSFAQREVTSVSRRDGIWYRARFAGLGALAASEACRLVSGRGGACEIVGR